MALLTPTPRRMIPSPAAGIWPGLFNAPSVPVHAAIARGVLRAAARKLPIRITFPDGTSWGAGGPQLDVIRPDAFFRRLGRDGLIGFGEAWMTGDITTEGWQGADPATATSATDRLVEVLTVLARRMSELVPRPLQAVRKLWQARQPSDEENTPVGAQENIHRHYDLSNDLFETFLDETMTYSAAWYEEGDDLRTAQLRKIDGILDLARVRPGSRVLEIGSGWGALAMRAVAERGATVTTLTLSSEQKTLAERRFAEAGVADRIEIRLEDYRAHAAANPGAYDAVVSVEMIEAVGEKYWPDYFTAVDRTLAPGGRMGLQAITIDHDRLLATRSQYTWVHKYIFPGGILPSLRAIDDTVERHTGLRVVESRRLGLSYATTLREWRHRFNANLGRIATLGFDATFVRMWNFYLAYCEAGFAAEYVDDWQLGLARS
jgi:cyclopropane-fatty-acyl-phospholipid synthase